MKRLALRIAGMTLAATLLIAGSSSYAEETDASPPEVTSSSVTKTDTDDLLMFFAKSEPVRLIVTARLTDASGISAPNPVVTVQDIFHGATIHRAELKRIEGDAKDGIYRATITIPSEVAIPPDASEASYRVVLERPADVHGNQYDGDSPRYISLVQFTVYASELVGTAAPSFDVDAMTYTIPKAKGLQYTVNGSVQAAGTYPGKGIIEVTASALPGFSLRGDWFWAKRFTDDPVSAPAVIFDDQNGTGNDMVIIPRTIVAMYYVNGEYMNPGSYVAEGSNIVTAKPIPGIELIGTTEWNYTFDPVETVTPLAPSFDDASGTYTIPDQRAIYYYANGKLQRAGTHPGNGKVTITAELWPYDDYAIAGDTSWTFTFSERATSQPFIDVRPGIEHYEHMVWMAESGTSTGWTTPNGSEYRPLNAVNRDAMAAFLYRLAGSPSVKLPSRSPFSDMRPHDEHYVAVIWAYQQGITTGWTMPNGTRQFRPIQPINRDAMAAFLYRYAGKPSVHNGGGCFSDVRAGMLYEKEMCWMKSSGISTGWSDGTYRPLQPVKRDAMAAFLHRYDARF